MPLYHSLTSAQLTRCRRLIHWNEILTGILCGPWGGSSGSAYRISGKRPHIAPLRSRAVWRRRGSRPRAPGCSSPRTQRGNASNPAITGVARAPHIRVPKFSSACHGKATGQRLGRAGRSGAHQFSRGADELFRTPFPDRHAECNRRAGKTDMRRRAFLTIFRDCRSGYLQYFGCMPFAEIDMFQPGAKFLCRHGRKPGFSGCFFGVLPFRIV